MNYNPYAAPQAAPPQAPPGPQAGSPQPWEIGEVLSRAWEIYKANWGVLSGALVVFGICTSVPVYGITFGMVLGGVGPGSSGYIPGQGGTNILAQLIQAFFMVGYYRIVLSAARGETPQFATLFSGGPRFLAFFGMTLLTLLAYVFGLLLLIVPAAILGCGWWAAGYFIADSEIGVIDSLKASWNAMNGHKMNYFLFTIVGFLLQLAGVLACCVGVLVTFPLFLVAQAIIFTRVTGRGPAMAPAAAGFGGPPPGYGGPPGGVPPTGGGYGGPPPGGAPPGGYGPPGGGGYGPPGGGGGYGPPPGGGYGPPGGGGGYGGPPGGGYPPR